MSAHERALSFGGRPGIPNLDLVKSALARPYSGYRRSIHSKCAALVESMAGNHGFADGNKRTTVILLHTFLLKSGYALRPVADDPPSDEVEAMVLDVVNHRITAQDLEIWFKKRIVRPPI